MLAKQQKRLLLGAMNRLRQQQKNLQQLFEEMLKYYSPNGRLREQSWRVDIQLETVSLQTPDENKMLFSIIDPFDKKHNPGNKVRKAEDKKVKDIDTAIKETLASFDDLTKMRDMFQKK